MHGGLYAIMHGIVEGYTDVADHIEGELEKLETQVFDAATQENVAQILRLRQRIGRIQRAVSGMSVSLELGK